jgi:putative oxidoreductase
MENKNIDIAALVLRVSLGAMFIAHGLLKIMVFTLPGTVQFFDAVGFPGWTAYAVTVAEIAGGIGLILGMYTRQIAYAMVPILLGAFYVHSGNGWLFTNQNGGWEYPLFLLLATVVQALLGSGRYVIKLPQQLNAVTT